MAEICVEMGWSFEDLRTHSLEEIAAVNRALDRKHKAEEARP